MNAPEFPPGGVPAAPAASVAAFRAALRALPDLGDPCADERSAIERLLPGVPDDALRAAAGARALRLIEALRAAQARAGPFAAQQLLGAFPLGSTEGIALLRLAEALLRTPDADTQTALIAEKLAAFRSGDAPPARAGDDGLARRVLGAALRLAGRGTAELPADGSAAGLRGWLARSTLRPLVIEGIRRFGEQFVFAPDLPAALARARGSGTLHSYDMLGEGARTAADAQRSFDAYAAALRALREARRPGGGRERDGISVKLSALHPRFETLQLDRVWSELYPRMVELACAAAAADITLTVDAEESDRLVLQVALVERLLAEPALAGWEGLGLALQAYQPRAGAALDHLLECAQQARRTLAIRLVKGAYWDAEIKRAQELGLPGFPVYTRKWATDLSYLALAARLFASGAPVYPQFATHNALTVASVVELARRHPARDYEFQRLHGMGEPLYAALRAELPDARLRVYAPVGAFRDLLAYLVRRLLENGANSSFVHQLADPAHAPAALVADPVGHARRALAAREPLPALAPGSRLFADRRNSRGLDLQHPPALLRLLDAERQADADAPASAAADAVDAADAADAAARVLRNPARFDDLVGRWTPATPAEVAAAVARAQAAQAAWDARGFAARAALLDAAAQKVEDAHDELLALLQREAGKTLLDAHLEVREAVDFLRYYAQQARGLDGERALPSPTGEANRLRLAGRGVFICISPWNFPLAIFVGQIAAALVSGNAVVAKPAEQTPLVALRAVALLHAAGVPTDTLHCLLGDGRTVGAALCADPRVAGVAFTGSTDTARAINRQLAARDAPLGVLIAETGGQNAMLVDATALPEQVCDAVVTSAFRSAGQRCSALRMLLIQEEIAAPTLMMIAGAMRELRLGDPADPRSDVGPVIDAEQLAALVAQRDWLRAHGRRIHECELPPALAGRGHYFAPIAYEIDALAQLEREHFGPILHVVRYRARDFDAMLDAINATGYGLTCGLHTRLDARVAQAAARLRVGNLYVNRNMIGAVVGSQPFGGEGLSGTGPKAGGPHYLLRFVTERALTVNTAAAGGNVDLLAGGDG